MVVPLDGSSLADTVLPLAGALAPALDLRPQIISVIEPSATTGETDMPPESSMVRSAAVSLEKETGSPVDYEVLHGDRPAHSIVEWSADAAMIAMSTHGRTGLARLVAGSVAMEVIHRAPCPVLVHRPSHFS